MPEERGVNFSPLSKQIEEQFISLMKYGTRMEFPSTVASTHSATTTTTTATASRSTDNKGVMYSRNAVNASGLLYIHS